MTGILVFIMVGLSAFLAPVLKVTVLGVLIFSHTAILTRF